MPKTIKEQVQADIEKAKHDQRKKRLKQDYDRFVRLAAITQKAHERDHYAGLAEHVLKQLNALNKT